MLEKPFTEPSDAPLEAPYASMADYEIMVLALESAQVGFAVDDIQTGQVLLSKVLWAAIGLSGAPRPIAFEDFADLIIDPALWENALVLRKQAIGTGEPFKAVYALRRADTGRRLTLSIEGRPRKNDAGVVTSIVHVSRDITEEETLRAAFAEEALAYQRAQEQAGVGHYVMDGVTGKISGSRMLSRIVGMPHAEARVSLEAVLAKLFTPDQLAASRARRARALKTGETYRIVEDIFTTDTGERRTIAVQIDPIFNDQGKVTGQFGVVRDITEFQEAERQLKFRERLLLRAEEMGLMGHFYSDYSTRRTHFSPMMNEIFGLEDGHEDQFGLGRLSEILSEKSIADYRLHGRAAVAARSATFFHTYNFFRKTDGARRVVEVETNFEYGDDGKVATAFGLARDVTQILMVQRELEFREKFFVRAQKIAQLSHWHHDITTKETFWSAAMYDIYGLDHSVDHLVGYDRVAPALADGELDRFRGRIREALSQGRTEISMDVSVIRIADGSRRTIHTNVSFEYDEDGAPKAVFGVDQDITERLAERQELERLEHVFAEANRSETLNFFAGGLAHELSNMLQPALSFGDLAQQAVSRGDDGAAFRYLENVMAAIERARTLTQETLRFVRLEPEPTAPVSLREILAPIQTVLSAVSNHLVWDVPVEVGPVNVHADSNGLMQILLNIVRNAIDAGGEDTRVVIEARRGSAGEDGLRGLQITISDDGPGILASDREKIFEPLFTHRSSNDGTGLGLPIARVIAERWGGALDVKSAEGGGAAFVIRLLTAD